MCAPTFRLAGCIPQLIAVIVSLGILVFVPNFLIFVCCVAIALK